MIDEVTVQCIMCISVAHAVDSWGGGSLVTYLGSVSWQD